VTISFGDIVFSGRLILRDRVLGAKPAERTMVLYLPYRTTLFSLVVKRACHVYFGKYGALVFRYYRILRLVDGIFHREGD
jgi:hypothetical protein